MFMSLPAVCVLKKISGDWSIVGDGDMGCDAWRKGHSGDHKSCMTCGSSPNCQSLYSTPQYLHLVAWPSFEASRSQPPRIITNGDGKQSGQLRKDLAREVVTSLSSRKEAHNPIQKENELYFLRSRRPARMWTYVVLPAVSAVLSERWESRSTLSFRQCARFVSEEWDKRCTDQSPKRSHHLEKLKKRKSPLMLLQLELTSLTFRSQLIFPALLNDG